MSEASSDSAANLSAVFLVAAGLVATTIVGLQRSVDLATILASGAVVAAAIWILLGSSIRGLSIGAITAGLALLAFWSKWLVDSSPPIILRHVPFDNDRAIQVFALFFVAFAAAWTLRTRQLRFAQRRPPARPAEVGTVGTVALTTLSVITIGLRQWLADTYRVGVPGMHPLESPFPAGVLGGLYYLAAYAPLAAGAVLVFSRSGAPRVAGYAILSAYTVAGVSLGYRSSVILACVVALYSLLPPHRRSSGRRVMASTVLQLIGLVALGLYALQRTLEIRPSESGGATRTPLQFLLERLGGLDYLSPVVDVVSRSDPSWAYASPDAWGRFTKVTVYGFPYDAVTGVASTLPGYLFGVAGATGLVVGGIAAGLLTGSLDRRICIGAIPGARSLWHLGACVAWANLLLEGTLATSGYIAFAFVTLHWLTALAPKPAPSGTRPRWSIRRADR